METFSKFQNELSAEVVTPPSTETISEVIHVEDINTCFFCKIEGMWVYKDMCDRLFDAPGIWNLMKCPSCDFIWLNPRPTAGDMYKAYAKYYTHSIKEERPKFAVLRKKIKNAILAGALNYECLPIDKTARFFGKVLGFFPLFKKMVQSRIMYLDAVSKGKLLDIGCGSGWFIAQMKDLGWDVLGIEPDSEAARVARDSLNVPVITGNLKEANLDSEFFDAITMNHIIEHVDDPLELLKECLRLLKTGGKIIIITPNIKSLGHLFFKSAWFHLDPPRHLYLFSQDTLKRFAGLAGLEIISLRTISRSSNFTWSASSMISRRGRWPYVDINILPWEIKLEGQVFRFIEKVVRQFWRWSGDELILIASKVK